MKKTVNLHRESGNDQEPAGSTDRYRKTLELFSAAWSRGDVDSLLSLMGDEPVYKGSTGARPGTLYGGREEVRAAFEKMAGGNAGADEPLPPATPPEMYFFSKCFIFHRRDNLISFSIRINVAAFDHATGHAGVGRLSPP